jgi:uncharacterized protein YqgC (DUF456 family)
MQIGPFLLTLDVLEKASALTLMLVGLMTIPFLPGLVIIWAITLGYGFSAGFGTLGWIMFAIISLLMVAGSFVDNVLMGTQAHKEGAPWWAVLVAMAAAIVGSFVIPIPIVGGILAALLVLFLIEWLRLRDWRRALASMKGMLVGCGWAFVIRFIIGMVMIGLWMIWAWA